MRTTAGTGARFYIGSASPEVIAEGKGTGRGKKVALTTGRKVILYPLLAEKIMGMLGRQGRREISGKSFDVAKERLNTPKRGKFTVVNFFVPESVFYKYKDRMKAPICLGAELHE